VTFFFLGEAYRDGNRLDRAMSAYREAARLEPEFARAWFELGAAYIRLGERDEVLVVLERLKKLDPMLAEELRKHLEARQRP
jgi:tetratricopeptide (TPR) repeat protein